LDGDREFTEAEEREEYQGLEEELTVAQQVKAEADLRYAEHAQQRWEEAERNDPDLIEAGVERLGDLVATDYFEKNHDPNAVSKLMEETQSSNEDS
jgi:RecA-family ATPase